MLNKIIIIICLLTMAGAYVKLTQDKIDELQSELLTMQGVMQAQELRQQEQLKTIANLEQNFAKTTEALQAQTARNSEIEAEKNRYLAIFARHDLSKLAAAKPGLIEKRINKGTKDVFESITRDTSTINN